MPQSTQNEIDIFDFFRIIARDWFSFLTILIGVLSLCFIYIQSQEEEYEANISFEIGITPPFFRDMDIQEQRYSIIRDYKKLFFDEGTFSRWKASDPSRTLAYDFIQPLDEINGKLFLRSSAKRNVLFHSNNKNENEIQLKTKSTDKIYNIFQYATYVNKTLTARYTDQTEKYLNDLRSNYASKMNENHGISQLIVYTEIFSERVKTGASSLNMQNPTIPVLKKPKKLLITIVFSVLGLLLGITFCLMREAYRRKQASRDT